MASRNCIIIHGCPSDQEKAMDPATRTYDKHWLPWTKKQLEVRGIAVKAPLMPAPWAPVYEDFKREFEKSAVGENSILIGHSCGGTFLVRWLGETKRKIHKLILVAPWKIEDDADEFQRNFYVFPVDIAIRDRVGAIIMFTAPDEALAGKKGLEMFHEALGGEVISLDGHGHYCLSDMRTEEFPELIKAVVK
jgi:predicted alpha/beta hydrolase family esterase